MTVVVLDCCRDFVYQDPDTGRSLSEPEVRPVKTDCRGSNGTAIVLTCAPNEKAPSGANHTHGMAAFASHLIAMRFCYSRIELITRMTHIVLDVILVFCSRMCQFCFSFIFVFPCKVLLRVVPARERTCV